MKKLLFGFIGISVALGVSMTAFAKPYVYFEKKQEETVMRGVTYTSYKQATSDGLRDVYVLKIPAHDPNVVLKSVESKTLGQRDTVKKLLTENNAVAGVNGDFFDMSGSLASSFGPNVSDGVLVSLNASINSDKAAYATFYTDSTYSPFIDYIKSKLVFFSDNTKRLDLVAENKITDMTFPSYFDRLSMADTAKLDENFKDLYKVVVDNGIITYVSTMGETVQVPENGYIITMSAHTANYHISNFKIGQVAEVKTESNVDFAKIQNAIGGGGKILQNGAVAKDSGYVAKGYHPRTAIGISQDGNTIILMVVDGRTHSIGANQEDMANLFLRFGAYNAMHLDGGGSSSFIVGSKLQNTPSEGSERRVINALGVFDRYPTASAISLKIETASDKVFVGTPVTLNVYGVDQYEHKELIPIDQVAFTSSDVTATFANGKFTTSQRGDMTIQASYNGMLAETKVSALTLSALKPQSTAINAAPNQEFSLSFTGYDANGNHASVENTSVKYEITPPDFATVANGKFTLMKTGIGFIKCSQGEAVAYVDVSANRETRGITSFEKTADNKLPDIKFIGYPTEFVTGSVLYVGNPKTDGNIAASLNYKFANNPDITQAAYFTFNNPIVFKDKLISLKMAVNADNSGQWLRMRLVDAEGVAHAVDISKVIDWSGYKDIEIAIPQNLKYPVSLERIYVAAIGNTDDYSRSIYIDNITGVFQPSYPPLPHPEATPQADSWVYNGTSYDQELVVNKNFAKLVSDHNTAVLHLTAAKGGLIKTNGIQWASFTNDILNNAAKNVLIVMDKNPMNFSVAQEYSLFHEALKDIKKATQKNIIVVSTEDAKIFAKAVDGIRYINIGLQADVAKPTSLRLFFGGDEIRYRLEAAK